MCVNCVLCTSLPGGVGAWRKQEIEQITDAKLKLILSEMDPFCATLAVSLCLVSAEAAIKTRSSKHPSTLATNHAISSYVYDSASREEYPASETRDILLIRASTKNTGANSPALFARRYNTQVATHNLSSLSLVVLDTFTFSLHVRTHLGLIRIPETG